MADEKAIAQDMETAEMNNQALPSQFSVKKNSLNSNDLSKKTEISDKIRRLSQMTGEHATASKKSKKSQKMSAFTAKNNKKNDSDLSSDDEALDDEEDALLDNVSCEDKTTFWGMTANLTLAGLGTGILSMPQCMASAGIFNAILWISIGLLLNFVTNYVIIVAGDRNQKFELEELMDVMPNGKWMKRLAVVGTWFMMFLAFSGYICAFKNFSLKAIDHIGGLDLDMNTPGIQNNTWSKLLMCAAAILVLPLCFLKQSQLAKTSTLSICINIYMMIVVFINFFLEKDQPEDPQITGKNVEMIWQQKGNVCFWSTDVDGNLSIYSMIMMAAVIQPCVLPMYKTLEDRSPKKFAQCMTVSYTFLTGIFSAFALMAYMTYGPNVDETVTNSLKMSKVQNLICMFGMSFVVLTVYPILLIPMISPIKSRVGKTAATFGIVGATLGFALVVFSFGFDLMFFNIMCGVVSGLFFIGIIPSIIGWYFLADSPEQRSSMNMRNAKWLALVFIGLSGTILGIVYSQPEVGIQHIYRGYVAQTVKLPNKLMKTTPLFEIESFSEAEQITSDFSEMSTLRRTAAKENVDYMSADAGSVEKLAKAAGLTKKRIIELRTIEKLDASYFKLIPNNGGNSDDSDDSSAVKKKSENNIRYSVIYDGFRLFDPKDKDSATYCKLSLNGGTQIFKGEMPSVQPTRPEIPKNAEL